MKIGIPKEIKPQEFRVGLSPASVTELARAGHECWVETGAGLGIHCQDGEYEAAGAKIASDAAAVFERAELIVKVKEPQLEECALLHEHHTLFTYLHLAADVRLTKSLIESRCTAIAYETVTAPNGGLPLLAPMSEVAGRLSVQAGARALERVNGGAGVLLGGVPGVEAAHVVVIGGGMVGKNAIAMALGLGARVSVLDKSVEVLRDLEQRYQGRLNTVFATHTTIASYLRDADLVIGAVLVPGARAPKLLTREMLSEMRPGSALVDVAIDQGGCFESSRPTTHAEPIFIVDGIVHYCVANMPGAVPLTSTNALNNATLPFVLKLADEGVNTCLMADRELRNGLNVHRGHLTQAAVAAAQGVDFDSPEQALRAA